MFGNATLSVPKTGRYDSIKVDGLSDALAMSYGRLFAMTLSERDGYVIVSLSNGATKVIGYDSIGRELRIGRLVGRQDVL